MIGLLLSPLGRWLGSFLAIALVAGGIYYKGYSDGKAKVQARWNAAEKAQLERNRTVREQAEREIPPLPSNAIPVPPDKPCRVRDPNDRDCG